MNLHRMHWRICGFSLVEVVLAMGIVSFVANDTSKRSRDETFAAQLAANEFERIRSLSAANFPQSDDYEPRYFDSALVEVGADDEQAVYRFALSIVPAPSPAAADRIFNAEVAYPARAPVANRNIVRSTTLMNIPGPTPTPPPVP
jgi:hypothetical protein